MEISLKDLIARLPIPGLKESADRHLIAETLTKNLGIPVEPKQITFKDSIVTVAVAPVVRSALQVRQKELLESLEKQGIPAQMVR